MMQILEALWASRAGLTLAELAERTGLHPRSVRRYVQDVASTFHTVTQADSDDGQRRWRLLDSAAGPPLRLGLDEALALVRMRSIATAAADGLFWSASLARLFSRLETAIPRKLREEIDRLASTFAAALPNARAHTEHAVHREFEQGAAESRALGVRYRSLRRTAERRYDPYVLYRSEGVDYAYGFDHLHQDTRVLALDRVVSVRSLGLSFARPKGFSVAGYLDDLHRGYVAKKRTHISLLLKGRAARLWRDRPEVADQRVEVLPDGRVRVQFLAPDTPALRARLLSFGAELEVEGPERLRRGVALELARAVGVYEPIAAVVSIDRKKRQRVTHAVTGRA